MARYDMNITEYINSTDADDRYDFESHVFENVFQKILSVLPGHAFSDNVVIWTDGTEILCKTQWLAETVADMIEQISGEHEAHTGYYDPKEDALEIKGPFPTTGWYYVDYD